MMKSKKVSVSDDNHTKPSVFPGDTEDVEDEDIFEVDRTIQKYFQDLF